MPQGPGPFTWRAAQQPLLPQIDRPSGRSITFQRGTAASLADSRASWPRPATIRAMAVPTKEQVTQALHGGDRPGASEVDRRAGDGPLDRDRRAGPGRRHGLADHARVPDPLPLPAGCGRAGRPARGGLGGGGRLRRALKRGEGPASAVAGPPAPPRGRAGPGEEHRLRRLRQGRRRQVDHDRQPGRRPSRRRARPAEPWTATSTATRSPACWASTASPRSTRSERSSP